MDMSSFTDEFMKEALQTEISVMKELKSDNVVRMYHVEHDKVKKGATCSNRHYHPADIFDFLENYIHHFRVVQQWRSEKVHPL